MFWRRNGVNPPQRRMLVGGGAASIEWKSNERCSPNVLLTYTSYIFHSSRTLVPMPTLVKASHIFITTQQPHKSGSVVKSLRPHHCRRREYEVAYSLPEGLCVQLRDAMSPSSPKPLR